jgi:hypothetical protein
MFAGMGDGSEFRFAPVTPATLEDLARFSQAYGKFRYCSCLRWRLRSGAEIIEAYPWPGGASYRYMGTRALYADAGFADVPGPEGQRPVMRCFIRR